MKVINRTVWILSLVSLFADIASEMLYPVIPVYLKEVGFSFFLIGVLEGVANFTSGISKGYFGKRSDEKGRRLPFVRSGYLLSAISKPMMAVLVQPLWIFLARTTDRLGKGLRTAARDALLAQQATPATRGRVFGLHRSMDTLGAAIGPALALLYLVYFPRQYRSIFLIAFIPGLISFALLFLLREKKEPGEQLDGRSLFSFLRYWKRAPAEYRRLVVGLAFLALFNSSDVFLLLRAREITGSDELTIGAYILYNVVFALASFPLGLLADRIGIRNVFLTGLVLFGLVYFLFGISSSPMIIFGSFFIYGLYAAATEGLTKAWISNIAQGRSTATAIGFYTSCESVGALLASTIAGILWTTAGSSVTFLTTSVAAVFVFAYFLVLGRRRLS